MKNSVNISRGTTPYKCTKGVSLPSGPRFARPVGRVAGWLVSLKTINIANLSLVVIPPITEYYHCFFRLVSPYNFVLLEASKLCDFIFVQEHLLATSTGIYHLRSHTQRHDSELRYFMCPATVKIDYCNQNLAVFIFQFSSEQEQSVWPQYMYVNWFHQ